MQGPARRTWLGLPAVAVLLLLPSCRGSYIRDEVQQAAQEAGIVERDDRKAMLESYRVLPPPREFREAQAVQVRERTATQVPSPGADSTAVLLARMIQRQDEMDQKHAELQKTLGQTETLLRNLKHEIASQTADEIKVHLKEVESRMGRIEQAMQERDRLDAARKLQPPEVIIPVPVPAQPEVMTPDAAEVVAEPELPEPVQPQAAKLARRLPRVYTPEAQRYRTQAREAYERILTQYPETDKAVEARMNLVQMELEDANVLAALQQCEKVLVDFPEHEAAADALLHAARLRRELGEYEPAIKDFLTFADRHPRDRRVPNALLETAETREDAGDLEGALAAYKHVLHRYHRSEMGLTAKLRQADVLAKLKRHAEARAIYAELAANRDPVSPVPVLAQLQTARSWLAENKPDEARQVLQQLLSGRATETDRGEAAFLMGESYDSGGSALDAARAYQAAADEYPKHERMPAARLRAGERMAAAGLNERAVVQYRKLLDALESRNVETRRSYAPPALLGMARAEFALGKTKEAQARVSELREGWPHHPLGTAADLLEAELLIRLNRQADAVKLLDRVIAARPGTPEALRAYTYKAGIAEQEANMAEAEKDHARMRKTFSPEETAEADFRHALNMLAGKNYARALNLFNRMSGDPLVPEPLRRQSAYYVPVTLERAGQTPEALFAYRSFLKQFGATEGDSAWLELVHAAQWKEKNLPAMLPDGTTVPDEVKKP